MEESSLKIALVPLEHIPPCSVSPLKIGRPLGFSNKYRFLKFNFLLAGEFLCTIFPTCINGENIFTYAKKNKNFMHQVTSHTLIALHVVRQVACKTKALCYFHVFIVRDKCMACKYWGWTQRTPTPTPPTHTHTPTNKFCAYGFEMRTQQRDLLIWKSALFWFIPQKINTYKCTHTKFDFLRESCLMFKDCVCICVSVWVTFQSVTSMHVGENLTNKRSAECLCFRWAFGQTNGFDT